MWRAGARRVQSRVRMVAERGIMEQSRRGEVRRTKKTPKMA